MVLYEVENICGEEGREDGRRLASRIGYKDS
jgi:hypothetical protein